MSHTPGPWRAFFKPKYDEWHVGVPHPDGSAMRVALFEDGIPTRNAADARLIAAAPDLLAALERILAGQAAEERGEDGGDWADHWEAARVAVKKARGAS